MTTVLNLAPEAITEILNRARKGSAIVSVAEVITAPAARDLIGFSFNNSDAAFHNAGDDTNKQVSNADVETVDIAMSTLYKIMKFRDYENTDNDSRALIANIERDLPAVLRSTLDKVAVGGKALVPSARFDGYTHDAIAVSDAASWLSAINAVNDRGYTPNAIILDNSFQSVLRTALTEGTNINPLTTNVSDGTLVAGTPLFFRDLGQSIGVVGDFRRAVIASHNGIEMRIHRKEDDFQLTTENADAVYAGWRVGYAVADQDAFQPITLGTGV